MLARELKYLAGVSDLARLDFEAAALTIRAEAGYVSALYRGDYSGGYRQARMVDEKVQDFEVSLSATRFRQLANLFPDEVDVTIVLQKDELVLRSREANVRMQRWGDVTPETDVVPEDISKVKAELRARIPLAALLTEMDIASTYVADSSLRPALTGIKLDFAKGNRLYVTAFDGFGLLFKSELEALRVQGVGSVIVPGLDFPLGLRLIQSDGDAVILKLADSDKVIIYTPAVSAYFNCALINSAWPDLHEVEEMQPVGTNITLTGDQIRALAASGRAFETKEVSLSANNGRSAFSLESEAGGYSSRVKGNVAATMQYDLESLAKVAKLGDRIDLTVPPTSAAPTIAVAGTRRCWVVARI